MSKLSVEAVSWGVHERRAEQLRLLIDPTILKIIQNMAFDVPHLHADGFPIVGPYWDTMYSMQLIDPDSPGFSLDEIASFVLTLQRWKHKGSPSQKPRLKVREWKRLFKCAREECTSADGMAGSGTGKKRICKKCTRRAHYKALDQFNKEAIAYNRMDSAVLVPIQEWQEYKLRATGQYETFKQMMITMEEVLLPMQEQGIKVDGAVRAQFQSELGTEAMQCRSEWKLLTGGVNPQSTLQMRKLVYETWNCPIQYKWDKKTKSRKIALDNAAIESIIMEETVTSVAAAPKLRLLQKLKKAEKWYATYTKIGDRIFPRYGPAKKDDAKSGGRYGGMAATGRIIAKGGDNLDGTKTPPIQQFPEAMKKLIIPDRDVLIALDSIQQELRICAYMSNCTKLIKMIEQGADIHAYNAEKFKCDRTRAKNMFYGAIFGARGRALVHELVARGFRISVQEADEFIANVRAEYPEIFKWHPTLITQVDRLHYVCDAFGGRRYFYTRIRRLNEILNFPIQATGARVQWMQLPSIQRTARSSDAALSILQFDSVVLDCKRDKAADLAAQVKKIMEQPYPQVHPDFWCPVDIKMGPSWGELEQVQL